MLTTHKSGVRAARIPCTRLTAGSGHLGRVQPLDRLGATGSSSEASGLHVRGPEIHFFPKGDVPLTLRGRKRHLCSPGPIGLYVLGVCGWIQAAPTEPPSIGPEAAVPVRPQHPFRAALLLTQGAGPLAGETASRAHCAGPGTGQPPPPACTFCKVGTEEPSPRGISPFALQTRKQTGRKV